MTATPPFGLQFDNRFARLPEVFYTKMVPQGIAVLPQLVHANPAGAAAIGLDPAAFHHPDFAAIFSGSKPLPGGEPLAMVYSGHQFGVWAGQLGDGRALLLGQVVGPDGQLWDIQLKGGGLTPYSRMGDGRAVLRSCIREYLCGEAMAGLGIPTTRSLCIVATGEGVRRETVEPGAVLTRLSPSHIRFGHFQHFYSKGDEASLRALLDYTIANHFSQMNPNDWFAEVVKRTDQLMAQWQSVGFCHGVMNTDNMGITGLTLDYGPYGFMEAFDPGHVCNHSDYSGRYAYDQQPAVAHWNLHALAVALQTILPLEETKPILDTYGETLESAYYPIMRAKIGIEHPIKGDDGLWQRLLSLMATHRADYTLTFRELSNCTVGGDNSRWLGRFNHDAAAEQWLNEWLERMTAAPDGWRQRMNGVNPRYVLRNWVAETAIRAVEDRGETSVLDTLLAMLANPYETNPEWESFASEAPEEYRHLAVSCSS